MRIRLVFAGDRKTRILTIGRKIQEITGLKIVHIEVWNPLKNRSYFYLEVRK